VKLEQCKPWPHVANRHIAMTIASYCHCDVILIMMSFATELATPSVTNGT